VRSLRLSFDGLWTIVAVALPALGALLAPLSTIDLAYQVRTGDLILANGVIPATDPFTFSAAGAPWVVQQWGAAVALAIGFVPAGWAGLLVLRAILVAAIFALVLVACRSAGATPRSGALLTIAAFLVAVAGLGLRAQLFGLLSFAAVLALVAARGRRPWLLFLAPLVILAWANLHGSFVLGLIAIGWALLDDLVARRAAGRRDAVVLLLALLASFVTPYGPGAWSYASSLATSPTVAGLVTEWQATTIRSAAGIAFFASALGVAALAGRAGRRVPWPTLLWLAALFALGAWTERGVVWWALGAAVAAAGILQAVTAEAGVAAAPAAEPPAAVPALAPGPEAPASLRPRATAANGILAIVLVAAPIVLALILLLRPSDPLVGPPGLLADAPAGVTQAVRAAARPGDRILNAQGWGSWLEWAVPNALVFTDSRFEVVPDDAWRDHVALSAGRFDWRAILARRDPDLIVASRSEQAGLLEALAAAPDAGWREVYADADGVVLSRR
jgi:hypothetical protein